MSNCISTSSASSSLEYPFAENDVEISNRAIKAALMLLLEDREVIFCSNALQV